MRELLIPGACVAALLATSALAQPAQPPGGPRPPGSEAGAPPPPLGPSGVRPGPTDGPPPPPPGGPRAEDPPHGGPHGMGPLPRPPKGAHFKLEMGDNSVDVKCDDDEPMRACADITMGFLDRMSGTSGRSRRYRGDND